MLFSYYSTNTLDNLLDSFVWLTARVGTCFSYIIVAKTNLDRFRWQVCFCFVIKSIQNKSLIHMLTACFHHYSPHHGPISCKQRFALWRSEDWRIDHIMPIVEQWNSNRASPFASERIFRRGRGNHNITPKSWIVDNKSRHQIPSWNEFYWNCRLCVRCSIK